jgi:hypothetical protein
MTRRSDPNPTYWEQYGPFQHVKHELIRYYLNGWYPSSVPGLGASCTLIPRWSRPLRKRRPRVTSPRASDAADITPTSTSC